MIITEQMNDLAEKVKVARAEWDAAYSTYYAYESNDEIKRMQLMIAKDVAVKKLCAAEKALENIMKENVA